MRTCLSTDLLAKKRKSMIKTACELEEENARDPTETERANFIPPMGGRVTVKERKRRGLAGGRRGQKGTGPAG